MIHRVANVIKRINEQKMRLYYSEFSSEEAFIRALCDIESLLYTDIASKLNYSEDIQTTIRHMLLINRLLIEKDALQNGAFSYTKQFFEKKDTSSDEMMLTFLQEQIKYYVNELMMTVSLLPHRYQAFKSFVQNKYKVYMNIEAVKEG